MSIETIESQFQQRVCDRVRLASEGVDRFRDRHGELRLPVPNDLYGNALYSFVQTLLKISDVTCLSGERVRSTFLEDFRASREEQVPAAHLFIYGSPATTASVMPLLLSSSSSAGPSLPLPRRFRGPGRDRPKGSNPL